MKNNITFLDFSEDNRFLKLQNTFASYDIDSNPNVGTYERILKIDFTVKEMDCNPVTGETTFSTQYFYKDFLIPIISSLASRYVIFFKNKVENEILEEERILLFAKHQLKRMPAIRDKIKLTDNYRLDIKEMVLKQLDIVEEYLSSNRVIPSFPFDGKIQMKMNRIDIIVLFLLLREHKVIKYYTNSELRLLLEKTFSYYNTKEKNFSDISTKSTTISDIFNGSTMIDTSLKRLRKLFSDENLYKLPLQ